MESCFVPQINHGIMDDEDDLGAPSSSSSADSTNSNESSSSEMTEDAISPASSSSPPPSQGQRSLQQMGACYEMSSLMDQLPFKRGLSKHFQGKSQSFTSLSDVRCVEDLAKRDRPYRKKLKPCKSYAAGLDSHKPQHSRYKAISKRPSSRGALPSLVVKRAGFFGGGRPPVPGLTQKSSGFSTHQTLLFA